MTKPPMQSPDPLVMKVRAILKDVEPRTMPTETRRNNYGHTCWVCPYCGQLVRRKDRYVLHGPSGHKHQELLIDYSSYNMHFAAHHATPFWRERQVIALLQKSVAETRIKELEAIVRADNKKMQDMYDTNMETAWSKDSDELQGKYEEKYGVRFYE